MCYLENVRSSNGMLKHKILNSFVSQFKVKSLWPFKYRRGAGIVYTEGNTNFIRSDELFFGSEENDSGHKIQAIILQNSWEINQVSVRKTNSKYEYR